MFINCLIPLHYVSKKKFPLHYRRNGLKRTCGTLADEFGGKNQGRISNDDYFGRLT